MVALHPDLHKIIEPEARVEKIAGGFQFTEGPVWDYRNQRLLFCDFNGEEVAYQWRPGEGHSVARESSGRINGSTIDAEGRLLCCEAVARRITRSRADGTFEVLADNLEGKRLNAPNDIALGPDGVIYFTDTPYGLPRDEQGNALERDLPFYGVYRLEPESGRLDVLARDLNPPNGIAVGSEGRQLFVDDTAHHFVRVFDLTDDGQAVNGRLFAETVYQEIAGRPDGMKLDQHGNLYLNTNTQLGVWVYNPAGMLLGFIGVGEASANCAFGDDDWSTLYVTAQTSVYRVQLKVAGQPVG